MIYKLFENMCKKYNKIYPLLYEDKLKSEILSNIKDEINSRVNSRANSRANSRVNSVDNSSSYSENYNNEYLFSKTDNFCDYFQNNMFCKNLCPYLRNITGIYEDDYVSTYDYNMIRVSSTNTYNMELDMEKNSNSLWIPPEKHGLDNSDPIFNSYYLTGKNLYGKIFYIDFFETIKDDIKNLRNLSIFQKKYLETLDHKKMQELISIYIITMEAIIYTLNNDL